MEKLIVNIDEPTDEPHDSDMKSPATGIEKPTAANDSTEMGVSGIEADEPSLKIDKLVEEAYAAQLHSIRSGLANGDFYEDRPWAHKSLMRCFCLCKQSLGHQMPTSLEGILHGLAEAFENPSCLLAIRTFKDNLIAAGNYYIEGVDDDDTEYDEPAQVELRRSFQFAVYEKLKVAEGRAGQLVDVEEVRARQGDAGANKTKGKHVENQSLRICFARDDSDRSMNTKRKRTSIHDRDDLCADSQPPKKRKPSKAERGPYTTLPAIANTIIDSLKHNDYEYEHIIASTDSSGRLRTLEELIGAIASIKHTTGRRTLSEWSKKRRC